MGRDQAESAEQKNQRCLEAYVVRARRVAEHSLAQDWDALVALTNPTIGVRFDNGEMRIRHELPPEEVVESAAARIRPIILEKEDCFHMKALKALGYACRALPREAEWVRAARAEWGRRVAPSTPADAAYRVLVSNSGTGEEHDLDAHRLAMAWIYGDVVHHDTERRREGDAFGLRDRFRAAVPLVAWTMVGTIELLHYIQALWEDGLLQLRKEVFDERVVLKSTVWEEPAQIYFAPVGTEPPSGAATPLPEAWTRLGKDTDFSLVQHTFGGQLVHPMSSAGVTERPSNGEIDAAPREGFDGTAQPAHGVPRPLTKDWQAELIERWKAMQP
ncbi:hypothetical protein [Streptomyces sp. NPDC056987]|uniref:hypothetical protein n=1 Tax=Streptomyces sp. NPDC056987 TaxID=3345988 RepID=UPI00362C56D5